MLIRNLPFLTWDLLMSAFLFVSMLLYLLASGKKAVMLLLVSVYAGCAIANSLPEALDSYRYSEYFRPIVFILITLLAVKILSKFVALKRGELTFLPAFFFSLVASGMFASVFFSLVQKSGTALSPLVTTIFVNQIANLMWLILPLVAMIAYFRR